MPGGNYFLPGREKVAGYRLVRPLGCPAGLIYNNYMSEAELQRQYHLKLGGKVVLYHHTTATEVVQDKFQVLATAIYVAGEKLRVID